MTVDLAAVATAARTLADTIDGTGSGLWSPDVAASMVLKAMPEQRFTLGVAYPAWRPDKGRAMDGKRDYAPADVVERTAWDWMAKSRRIGLHHGDLIGLPGGADEGHATLVESYIYRGPDWLIKAAGGAEQLVQAGDWLLGLLWDGSGWDMVKRRLVDGMSPVGRASRVTPTVDRLALLRRQ